MSNQSIVTIQSGFLDPEHWFQPAFPPLGLLVPKSRNTVTVMSSGGKVNSSVTYAGSQPSVRDITNHLLEKYPLITIDDEIFGEPRLKGHRFGVSDVLSALCVFNSFEDVIEEHGNRYTEQDLKDAVRFARDFLDSFYTS